MHIAVGGFQHETNTFAPMQADYAAFERADAWPALTEGEAIFDVFPGRNLPIAGFMAVARAAGHTLAPLSWCSAGPSSYVTEDAFERVSAMLLERLARAREAGTVDAVYLDLHGAMVAEHLQDGEGELLARVRSMVGDSMPVVASLDLHANVTEAIVRHADALTIYRTYPHLDMANTGARVFELLERVVAGELGAKTFAKAPFMMALPAQYTGDEPCSSIYAMLGARAPDGVASMDLACGFPPADIYDCGPAVVAFGSNTAAVKAQAARLMRVLVESEPQFAAELLTPDEAVLRALEWQGERPVVLADVQDNPGAGGSSDTVGLLEALVRNEARGAVLGLLDDPAAAAAAHAAGQGAELELDLGGKSGQAGQSPLSARVRVLALTQGRFPFTGEMYAGSTAELGPTALLGIVAGNAEVQVVVGSQRVQCLDRAIFTHIGIDLERTRIVAVKSTVHFRADFEPMAGQVLLVEAPGAHPCRLDKIPYQNLRPGVRLGPLGPPF
ncbi:MAG: M81 family metallopeptidase [Gammaproteobacteria bacterium]